MSTKPTFNTAGRHSLGGAPLAADGHHLKSIVIVGGGLSGTLVAIQLLQRASSPLRIVLIEPRAEAGRGIAYSTTSPSHLLNVRAGNMSVFPERTDDFLKYLKDMVSSEASATQFAQRRYFGAYVGDSLRSARENAANGVCFEHIRDSAEKIDHTGDKKRLAMESGAELSADAVVLAIGNNPPTVPFDNPDGVEVISGWAGSVWEGLAEDDSILIIGSGLTGADAVLALIERHHRGAIHVVSRHGRWPMVHETYRPSTLPSVDNNDSLLSILRSVRALVREAGEAGDSWQSVFDQLRPLTNSIWRRLGRAERHQFLRHCRPLWEVHRHRMPPEAAAQIDLLRHAGRLVTHRGRVLAVRRTREGLIEASIADSEGSRVLTVHRLVLCTGPDLNFRRAAQPIIGDLLDGEMAQLDSANLGLLVSDNYALLQKNGVPSSSLFALGPLIKGSLWETTALPEIRVQARDLALHLLEAVVADSREAGLVAAEENQGSGISKK